MPAMADPEREPTNLTPRSRRALLTGALGTLGGLIVGGLGRPETASAAAGSPLIIGSETNNAGTSDTQLIANSDVISLKVYQQGAGTALMGYVTRTTGSGRGVYGRTDSPNGDGVQARNAGAGGTGAAIRAIGGNNPGLVAQSTGNTAIEGTGDPTVGVHGISSYSSGVRGDSTFDVGVYGVGGGGGVVGNSPGNRGVWGYSTQGIGVYGQTTNAASWAGWFSGAVHVAGTLTKAAGAFRIDHPLDPAGRYLQHSFVESSEMKNIYDGVVELRADGSATVDLPGWFHALNRDLRYQLTPIGGAMPDLHVAAEATDGRFTVAGGTPGRRVSWQVTGNRADAYALAHPIEVEVDKAGADKGRYLHPAEHGQPRSKGVETLQPPAGGAG